MKFIGCDVSLLFHCDVIAMVFTLPLLFSRFFSFGRATARDSNTSRHVLSKKNTLTHSVCLFVCLNVQNLSVLSIQAEQTFSCSLFTL